MLDGSKEVTWNDLSDDERHVLWLVFCRFGPEVIEQSKRLMATNLALREDNDRMAMELARRPRQPNGNNAWRTAVIIAILGLGWPLSFGQFLMRRVPLDMTAVLPMLGTLGYLYLVGIALLLTITEKR